DGLTRVASGEINWEINWEPGFEALRQVLGIVAQFGDPRAIDWNTIIGDHHYFDGIKSAYSMLLCDENDFDRVFDEFHAVRPVSVDSERLYLYLEADKREMVVQEFTRFLEHLKGLTVLQDAGIV